MASVKAFVRSLSAGCGVAILSASATSALALAILPGLPPGAMPAVGNGNPLSAVRIEVTVSTSVQGERPGSVRATDGSHQTETKFTEDYHDTAAMALTAASESGGAHVLALGQGTASFGTLRGSALALDTLDNTLGFYDVSTYVTVEFLDVMTVSANGGPKPNFKTTWAVDGSVSSEPKGSATAVTEVWMFPFGPFPQPGTNFFGTSYYGDFRDTGGTPFVNGIGDTDPQTGAVIFNPGSYWIYGRISLSARRGANEANQLGYQGATSADFLDTVTLSITPDASTPNATFTTSSGYDYAPLPEPATGVVLGLGVPALPGLRRPRRS